MKSTQTDPLQSVDKLKTLAQSPRPISTRSYNRLPFRLTLRNHASALNLAEKIRIYSPARPRSSRQRPKRIIHDKEQLYEEKLVLKARNNLLEEENMRLRTGLVALKKELVRREEVGQTPESPHLVVNLKQTVKDLKLHIRTLEDTISHLKRDIRTTRLAELTAEVETLQQECIRLNAGIENRLKEQEINQRAEGEDEIRHENQRMKVEMERKMKKIEEMEGKIRKMKQNEETWEIEKEKMRNECENLVQSEKKEREKLEKTLESLQKVLKEHENSAFSQESELNRLKSANIELFESLEVSKRANIEVNNQLSAAKAALSEALSSFQSAQTEGTLVVSDLQRIHSEEIGALRKELEGVRDRLEGEGRAVREALGTAAELERKNVSLTHALEKLHLENERLRRETDENLQTRLTELRKEAEAAHSQALNYSLQLDSQTQTHTLLHSSLSKLLQKPMKKMRNQAKKEGFSVEEVVRRLDGNGTGKVTVGEWKEGLKRMGLKVKKRYREGVVGLLGSGRGEMELKRLKEYLKTVGEESGDEVPEHQIEDKVGEVPRKSPADDVYEDSFEANEDPAPVSVTGQILYSEGDQPEPPLSHGPPANPHLEDQLNTLFKHISIRCQLHRLQRDKVATVILGKDSTVSVKDIKERLSNPPIDLKSPLEVQLLVLFLLGKPLTNNNLSTSYDSSLLNPALAESNLLSKLSPWEIFTEENEAEFDALTAKALTPVASDFQILCETKDSGNTGTVSIETFCEILQSLKVEFSERHLHYLSLLFYSQDQMLEVVPYVGLISAYVKEEDTEECLKEIAEAMTRENQRVRDVLVYNMQGLVYLPDLEQACHHLHLSLSSSVLESLLRSLQSPLSSSPCLHIKDLETALEPYGVPVPDYKLTSTGHFEHNSSSRKSSGGEGNE